MNHWALWSASVPGPTIVRLTKRRQDRAAFPVEVLFEDLGVGE